MTSKERVLTAFRREEPDRVPVDYCGNAGIDARLKEHFGLRPDDGPLRSVDFPCAAFEPSTSMRNPT